MKPLHSPHVHLNSFHHHHTLTGLCKNIRSYWQPTQSVMAGEPAVAYCNITYCLLLARKDAQLLLLLCIYPKTKKDMCCPLCPLIIHIRMGAGPYHMGCVAILNWRHMTPWEALAHLKQPQTEHCEKRGPMGLWGMGAGNWFTEIPWEGLLKGSIWNEVENGWYRHLSPCWISRKCMKDHRVNRRRMLTFFIGTCTWLLWLSLDIGSLNWLFMQSLGLIHNCLRS